MAVKKTRTASPRSTARRSPGAPRWSYGTQRSPFINLSSDWYWEQDAGLRFTYIQADEDLPEEERGLAQKLIGRLRWETGIEVEGGWDAHRELLAARKPFREILMWRTLADGSRRWISTSGQPVFDPDGSFAGYRGVGRNITEQKLAEARVRASESRLRAIVDNEPECVKLLDAQGNLLDMNPAGLRMIEADELAPLRGQCVYGLVAAEHVDGFRELVQDVARGAQRSLEFEIIGLKGTRRWMELRAVPLRDEPSGATLVLAITRDITDRRRAETQLRESESRFRALTELSSDWYWEQDTEYRFTRLEGRNVKGQDRALADSLAGQRRWDDGALECEGGWRAHRAALDARQPFYNVLMWRRARDGNLRHVRISGEPVFDAEGRFTGYRGVGHEITAEKRGELLLRLEHDAARALASSADAASGVRGVLRAFCEGEGLPCGRYFELDEPAGLMRYAQAWHVSDPDIERIIEASRGMAYAAGQGLIGGAWQRGEPMWSLDMQNDPRVHARALAEATGIRGVFAFPAVSEGKALGVLTFEAKEAREPDARLLQSARVIGGQLGQFLRGKQAEESLRESEARFRSLTQMSTDFFWETDTENRVSSVQHGAGYVPTAPTLLGKRRWDLPSISPDEAGWAAHRALLDARKPFRDFEFGRALADGTRYVSISGEPRFAADGRFLGYRGVGRDVTEIALARERIATLAYSDPLTGLANRTSLGPSLEQAVQRSRRRGSKLAVIFIDLDGFKEVNDLHGHDAGDALLVELAGRLRAHLRASDLFGRLGGDEFLVVLEEVQELGPVETVAKKLLGEMRRPFAVPRGEVTVTGSIGISVFPGDAADGATLMKHADSAMYAAKQAGKNCLAFFTSGPAANEADPQQSSDAA